VGGRMSLGSPYDPYRSPTLPEGPYVASSTSAKPGRLSAVCVICLVLGGLGLGNSLLGVVQVAVGSKLQQALQPKGGAGIPPEMQKAQDEFQAEINAVEKRYWTPMVISLAFRFLAATLLLVGGIRALGLNESGRRLLIAACAVALCFELGHAISQTIINMEIMTAFNQYVEGIFDSLPQGKNGPPAGFRQGMQTGVRIAVMAGFAVFYILMAVKAGFYLYTFFYLQKAPIKALFTDKVLTAKLV